MDAIERKIGFCQDIRSIQTLYITDPATLVEQKPLDYSLNRRSYGYDYEKWRYGEFSWYNRLFYMPCQSCCERRIFYKYIWAILVIEGIEIATGIALGFDILF